MSENFLIDTSALVRFYRRQAAPAWDEVVTSGVVGLCAPVRQEFLRAVGGRPAYYEADGLLRETFPYFVTRDSAWEDASALQQRMADEGCHQSASPVDLLVAVTAQHHKLTVLHQDADFETIARITGQPVRRIAD
ncbi:PIN domain nuclease [Streptomyces sp. A1547]|uniref:PIN domain nuclease n=1 Tax=Streptomyces sp. A1547 TaxID=2563105 RepID=UPI00061FB67F|nr:PIN domain nuclease [Streptomyces sp. A1547]KJY33246.1 PIN family toxin-antitoxin system, toxin component [Streptomyces sp. NRRL S-444]THA36982.1 PIN domain nuclease [Streptomyces sp. A1547]